MRIDRVALLDPQTGMFIADRGGGTLELHQIKIFCANPGEDAELQRWGKMFPDLIRVPCEGDWVERYGIKNS